jgi:hypothetical protein
MTLPAENVAGLRPRPSIDPVHRMVTACNACEGATIAPLDVTGAGLAPSFAPDSTVALDESEQIAAGRGGRGVHHGRRNHHQPFEE